MNRPIRLLLGAAVALAAAACATLPPTPPPGPADVGAVRDALLRDEAALRTLRGLADVRYDGPGGGGSASQVVVVALPDRARLETLSPVGTAALILVLDGDQLRVHNLLRHEFGAGRATRQTLARLVRLPLPPGPLLRLLAGLPPLPLPSDDPRLVLTPDGASVRVESVDGPFWQRLWTAPGGIRVERGEMGDASGPLLSFQFEDRRQLDGASVPFEIRAEVLASGGRFRLHYEQLRINTPIEPDLFELARPAGTDTRFVDLDRALPEGPAPGRVP